MSSVQSARGPVLCSSSWLCHPNLSSVLHVTSPNQSAASSTPGITSREECVVLELPCPTGDVAPPCTLTLSCAAAGTHHMLDVGLYSGARTVEVYAVCQDGEEEEYLGTVRGDACTIRRDDDTFTLYRASLKFDYPVPACRVKLLSLGGKQSVLVGEISVQVTSIPKRCSQSPSLLGPSINMERVQSIMDSMGGKMSPGAEQLMNMVRAQQKNPAPFGAHLLQLFGGFQPLAYQKKEDPKEETPQQADKTADTRADAARSPPSYQQASPSDVRSVMTSMLQSQLGQDVSAESVLPLLKNLAVQRNADGGRKSCSMPREDKLDPALEKVLCARMERMERNLMDHIDQKMKCLQEHLDTRMDQLFVCLLERGGKANPHPVTTGDKLINGHTDYTHDDADCNVLSVHRHTATGTS